MIRSEEHFPERPSQFESSKSGVGKFKSSRETPSKNAKPLQQDPSFVDVARDDTNESVSALDSLTLRCSLMLTRLHGESLKGTRC